MSGLIDAVVNVVSTIFGGGQQQQAAPTPPVVQPPTPMPTPDDQAVQAAKKKSISAIVGSQGRASTILSGNDSKSDPLGA